MDQIVSINAFLKLIATLRQSVGLMQNSTLIYIFCYCHCVLLSLNKIGTD